MSGYIGSKAAVVSSGAERKKTFAITATTTSLTGLSYTPGFVHVFHNGVRLVDGTDYTATNGTSITLTNAAESGDEVVVVSYATFTPADAYTKAEADSRYVNAAGDTMTGGLTVTGGRVLIGQTAGDYAQFGKDTGGNAFIDATQSDADFSIYINSTSTGYNKKLGIDSAGRVTMPYQPSWSLQPNYATLQSGPATPINFAVTPNWLSYANNVSISGGAVTVPVAGKYFVSAMFRQEGQQTDYQLLIYVNGASVARSGVWYTSQQYESISISRVLNLQANDYVEVNIATPSGTTWNGYVDALTFFEGFLIG